MVSIINEAIISISWFFDPHSIVLNLFFIFLHFWRGQTCDLQYEISNHFHLQFFFSVLVWLYLYVRKLKMKKVYLIKMYF